MTFSQVLRNGQFFRVWLAQFISSFGDWLAGLALFSLVAFRWHGTPYQVSGILIAFLLPWAVLGPVAGVFVDRWNPKRTMIASDLVRAVIAALLVFATRPAEVYALIFLLSCVSTFFQPAQTSLIPRLVRREQLLVANAANAQSMQLTKTVAPAVAGLLVAWAGEKLCFWIDSASFLFSAALLAGVAAEARETGPGRRVESVFEELRAGLALVVRHPGIRFVTAAMVGAMLAVGAFDALIAVYVRDLLRAETRVFGALVAVIGLGTILGALLVGKFAQKQPRVALVALGIFAVGVGMLAMVMVPATAWALAWAFAMGLAVSSVLVPSQTLIQEETPPAALGRVSSTAFSLMTVTQAVGASLAGRIANAIGIRRLYVLLALVLIATGFFGYLYARATRLTVARTPTPET